MTFVIFYHICLEDMDSILSTSQRIFVVVVWMLGAWFMATDYVTSPITSKGKILFGICLGCLTGLFRLFGGSAEGVSYAIIISNLFSSVDREGYSSKTIW